VKNSYNKKKDQIFYFKIVNDDSNFLYVFCKECIELASLPEKTSLKSIMKISQRRFFEYHPPHTSFKQPAVHYRKEISKRSHYKI